MRFFAVVAALISAVSAETFFVTVGGSGSLTFNPTSVKAAVGDVVAFQFVSGNHTVTQSTFASPCTAMAGGVDSTYQFVGNATGITQFPQWSVTVENATAPLWFYCKQGVHCTKGMVFAINPTADKTFEAYQAKAMGVTTTSDPSQTSNTPNGATGVAARASLVLGSLGVVAFSLL